MVASSESASTPIWAPHMASRSCNVHDKDGGVLPITEPPTCECFQGPIAADSSSDSQFSSSPASPSSSTSFEDAAFMPTSPVSRWPIGVDFDDHTNTPSPISRIPDEVMGEIFNEFVMSFPWDHSSSGTDNGEHRSRRQYASLSLMCICSRWRNVCVSTPKLWVHHYVPPYRSKSKPLLANHGSPWDPFESYINLTHYTTLALSRSKGCPLHVHITLSPFNPIAAATHLLFDASDRWRSAYITAPVPSTSSAFGSSSIRTSLFKALDYPILEELTLNCELDGDEQEYLLPSFERAPKLDTLRVVKMIRWPIINVADGANGDLAVHDDDEGGEGVAKDNSLDRHLPYSQIRTLTGSASLPALYTLLKQCVNLERVEVEQVRFPGFPLPYSTAFGLGTVGAEASSESFHHKYSHYYDWNSTFDDTNSPFNNPFFKITAIDALQLHTLSITLATDQPPLTSWLRRAPSLKTLSLTGGKLSSKYIHEQVVDDLIGFLRRQRYFSPDTEESGGLESFTLSTVELTPEQLIELFTLMPSLKELKLGKHAWGSRSYLGDLLGNNAKVLERLRASTASCSDELGSGSSIEGHQLQVSGRVLLPKLANFSLYFPRPPSLPELEDLLDAFRSRMTVIGLEKHGGTMHGVDIGEGWREVELDIDVVHGSFGMHEI
ncbi:hypothetical protein FB446DRAFT_62661 [Lentinula raphanica]|nr:hypothetical protein FB446DRAFT_62661 [Lentinula raphanica]